MQAFIIKSSMGWVHVVCEVHLHRQQKKIQSQTKFRSALENTTLSANSNAFYYKRLGSSHIMDAEPKAWEPSMNCRATILSSAELAISDPSLCQTLLPLSRKYRQPHKCFLPVYWASWAQFSYSVTCPPLIRPISLMQAIRKAWSFQITLKSTARRVWLIWTARTFSLAIVSGPIWPWMCMNQASHSHWYPSVSIFCQTESEIVGRVPDPVVRGWSIATSGFRFSHAST